jgi:hypothetical protein
MPLFNNATIATSFEATVNPNLNDTESPGSNKKNRNGIGTNKTKLVKQDVPIGVTVLRLVFLVTKDNYYVDLDDAITEQELESILEILENQE